MKNILGRKVGMTSVFTEDGRYVPVTVIAAGPCTVVERKTKEKHGYDAVALGFEPIKRSRVTRALAGHFKKQGVEPVRFVREFRDEAEGEPGQSVTVTGFEPGDRVDVVGISKGHGFAGGIKRHNFSGGGASHGSMIHRQPASNGDTNAGRTVKGQPPPGTLRRRPHDAAEPRGRSRRRRAQSSARPRRGAGREERAGARAPEREDAGKPTSNAARGTAHRPSSRCSTPSTP